MPPPPVIELVQLPASAIAALADGDLAAADVAASVPLSAWLVSPGPRRTWGYRMRQLAKRPSDADWITRVIWDPALGRTVGQAGFHGPPDEHGRVEVGYGVDPDHRRHGYARAAFVDLLERARHEPSVRVLRVTISPGNVASEHLIAPFGLVRVGEQWDEEDGLEIVYELSVEVDR
ncbi:MAG: GNAT family N-acetyltransferase [Propionibacteriaceae bacterium]